MTPPPISRAGKGGFELSVDTRRQGRLRSDLLSVVEGRFFRVGKIAGEAGACHSAVQAILPTLRGHPHFHGAGDCGKSGLYIRKPDGR